MKDAVVLLLRSFAWRSVTYLPGDKITLPLEDAEALAKQRTATIIYIKNRG